MMGSGGVGGYYGARLAQAGEDVVFIARGAHAKAMREKGLSIKSETGDAVIKPVSVKEDPAQAGVADVIVVAVKLWGSESAAQTRKPVGPVREHPATRAMLLDALREAAAVARAEGVPLAEDLPDKQLQMIDGLAPSMTSSMAQDLARQRPLELEWLSGAVVRRGEAKRVPTPVHRAIYAALALHAKG